MASSLPPHSFLMARWKPEVSEVLPSNGGEDLCHFCGGPCPALAWSGNESATFSVVVTAPEGPESFRVSPEGMLLGKILEAMGLDPAQVGLVHARGRDSGQTQCLFGRLKESGTRFLLAFGAEALNAVMGPESPEVTDGPMEGRMRGKVYDCRGIPVLGTESLRNLVENTALKRAAWEEIKFVIRELGSK
ncbi:MAG: hypothetical protein EBX52_03060 [Proteobacteria bacterium]|nr:hypothetical protein [Pseudomonadota bacterium]